MIVFKHFFPVTNDVQKVIIQLLVIVESSFLEMSIQCFPMLLLDFYIFCNEFIRTAKIIFYFYRNSLFSRFEYLWD